MKLIGRIFAVSFVILTWSFITPAYAYNESAYQKAKSCSERRQKKCDLTGQDLSGADISGFYLREVIAVDGNWRGIIAENTKLQHAKLEGLDATADENGNCANFAGAVATSADFSYADLECATLPKILYSSVLYDTNLDNTEAEPKTTFENSEMWYTSIRAAKLPEARLDGVDLRTVKGIFTVGLDIEGARYDINTWFPKNFDPEAYGMHCNKLSGSMFGRTICATVQHAGPGVHVPEFGMYGIQKYRPRTRVTTELIRD